MLSNLVSGLAVGFGVTFIWWAWIVSLRASERRVGLSALGSMIALSSAYWRPQPQLLR